MGKLLNNDYMFNKTSKIELLDDQYTSEPAVQDNSNTAQEEELGFIPAAENINFFERGNIVVKVMDNHNFYEAEEMSAEYLNDASIGLLTKIWINISRSLKE